MGGRCTRVPATSRDTCSNNLTKRLKACASTSVAKRYLPTKNFLFALLRIMHFCLHTRMWPALQSATVTTASDFWEWFWKRVEEFSDQSALMIRDRAHTSTMLPGKYFNTVFDIIQAKVMTLNCQDVRAADEELCVYLSAIMTWLLLPANSICSLIPTLVSYDDFVRESEFDTGPRLCHARWYHAQTCVRHLVAIYTTVVQA